MIKRWSFSLVLGSIYLLIFNLWLVLPRNWIIATGITATLLLLVFFSFAVQRGYFVNFWDGLLHLVVIIDVFLEAILIPIHRAKGFYLCVLAFAVVIAGYRFYSQRREECRGPAFSSKPRRFLWWKGRA